jgi:GTP diphosphokinase / guanosine-3',5'-bis(diphosphate) 3'-diphosphatase
MMSTHAVPDIASRSPLIEGAYRMAHDAHHGPRSDGDTEIDHPLAVAELLSEIGCDDRVVAAALLHDVVEDTSADTAEIEERFGPEVARLVEAMTENDRIEPYEARKAEHRRRVTRDRNVAAIYAADKLAGAREMREHPDEVPDARLHHYLATLALLGRTHPDLPFLGELHRELERIREARDRGARG